MICPRCQSDNPAQAVFCFKCGTRFHPDIGSPVAAPQPAAPLRKGFAIASLIVGILSLVTCSLFIIGSVTGIVLGVTALVKASNRPLEYGGKGMAIAGVVVSFLSLLTLIPAAIAIPNLLRAQQAVRERTAIDNLRTIARAESIYFNNKLRYGSLEELYKDGLIDAGIRSGTASGYLLRVRLKDGSFEALAVPEKAGTFGTGRRSFYVGPESIIRVSDGEREATSSDPPLQTDQTR